MRIKPTMEDKITLVTIFDGWIPFERNGAKGYFKGDVNDMSNWRELFGWQKYHTSWEHIMPVVSKAYTIARDINTPTAKSMRIMLYNSFRVVDISKTFESLYHFARWYNMIAKFY